MIHPQEDPIPGALALALSEFGAVSIRYGRLGDDAAIFDRKNCVLWVDYGEPTWDNAARALLDAVDRAVSEQVLLERASRAMHGMDETGRLNPERVVVDDA